MQVTRLDLLDQLLQIHAPAIGADLPGYRNHAYRLVNFTALSQDGPERMEKLAIAAAFHNLGMWTAHTFDYLQPSIAMAAAYLDQMDRNAWRDDITAMMELLRKLTPGTPPLAEAFRRADWADFNWGVLPGGVPRAHMRAVRAVFPDAGFHAPMLRLSCTRLLTHPLDPLAMMKF
ncbi:hypothetical protein ACLB1G_23065 [Oxalobacteraceae bacterium A2-2]